MPDGKYIVASAAAGGFGTLRLTLYDVEGGTGVQLTMPGAIGGDGSSQSGLGLGSLGVLPRLDFGLELLYGAPEQPVPEQPSLDSLPDSLTLHGSVKKTF